MKPTTAKKLLAYLSIVLAVVGGALGVLLVTANAPMPFTVFIVLVATALASFFNFVSKL